MERVFFAMGGVLGALGVIAGAFGAHALRQRVSPELISVWDTGARYHLVHAVALLAVAWAVTRFQHPAVGAAGWLFVAGIVVFSGSLYLLAATGARWLGAVTPLGGLCFIAGWLALAWGAWRG